MHLPSIRQNLIKMERTERIAQLISARMLGQELTEEEKRELDDWLGEEQANKDLLEEVRSLRGVRQFVQLEQEGYGEQMAAAFAERCRGGKRRSLRRIVLAAVGSAAAVVVLVVGLWMWTGEEGRSLPEVVAVVEDSLSIQRVGTVLTLASGERIDLKQEETEKAATRQRGERVIPAERMAKEHPEAYHTLSVPAGGEFQYVLADGTKVWLNSDSELRFPVTFVGDRRSVEIEGEAYFEVAKDEGKPFHVLANGSDIKVVGTSFNVMTYRGRTVTTLVEGKVCLTYKDESVLMVPDRQAEVITETGKILMREVDARNFTLWKDGVFYFENAALETIAERLSQWYDVNIIFNDEALKQLRYSVEMKRYNNIQDLLTKIEKTQKVKFLIQGKSIYIRKWMEAYDLLE